MRRHQSPLGTWCHHGPLLMIFGIVVLPITRSKQGKRRRFWHNTPKTSGTTVALEIRGRINFAKYHIKVTWQIVRGTFPQRRFCTSWTRIEGRILGCKYLSSEFWGRIQFLSFFPIKRAPSKIHPGEIHRQKFTSKKSTQNSGWKIHIALLQSHFADKLFWY